MVMEIPGIRAPFEAAADLSAKQYCAMKITASQKVNVCNVAGEISIGILQNDPTQGQEASVMLTGISNAVYGGTVAPGASLTTNASGFLITAAAGNKIMAVAIEAGAANEIHPVILTSVGAA